ncbi:HK97 family phage prohead protease [Sphingopyxis sp. MG]|uniref:HK97 family phage prohead protease n=1 Tax=Sphingopyxis sp. MG TaxID=1866325 RepID=UPI000CDF5415|nr:HK97 family phage prohead protease [Sphingopyxis sp. MG]AVA15370.1 HK97 family phage prohead protease [Sphingopyxis sp. MG]
MTAGGDMEHRSFIEVRAQGRRIEGYAATYGSEARLGGFVETIAPGAFRSTLGGDILALLDHDAGKVLGRTRSGTLRLTEDSRGLAFSLDLPDTQAGRDVEALAARGDLGGMSFGFKVPAGGERWDGEKRTLYQIDLREVSIVQAWPAYPDTEVALRSARDAWLALPTPRQIVRRRRLAIAEASIWA